MTVLEAVGRVDGSIYKPRDWHERDNFPTLDAARAYATFMARMHPPTPYRIVARGRRFAVQYVPAWRLRNA